MYQVMRKASIMLAFCVISCSLAAARSQNEAPAAKDDASAKKRESLIAERDAARVARDKAFAALNEANEQLEEKYALWLLNRFPDLGKIEAIRETYRLEPRFRKAVMDIERLERLQDHPETRGNEPADLDIPALIAIHENVLKSTMRPTRSNKPFVPPFGVVDAVPKKTKPETEAFVAQLRRNPTKPSAAKDRLAIFLIDMRTSEVLLVADEPEPGFTYCGSPEWSVDGTRILFDATPAPGNRFAETRLKALELVDGALKLLDLGPGNCPTGMPESGAIVFLLNSGAVAGASAGVWSRKADGTDRATLCEYGRPAVSPDGKRVLVSSFGNPKRLTMLDVESGGVSEVALERYRIASTPVWVDPTSFVAMTQSENGEAITHVDVSSPKGLRVDSTLWKLDPKIDLYANHPALSSTGHCAFVGLGREGRALYSVIDAIGTAKRLESGPFDNVISSLAFSPDGKYLLFCSDRPGEIKKKP